MRKKVLNGHCILVLDEATSNLDDATQEKFKVVIDTEFSTNTVLSVAHRMEMVRDVDVLILLENGNIAKMGPPSDIL